METIKLKDDFIKLGQAFSSETSNANNPSTLYIDYYTNRRYCENLTKDGIINKQKKDLIKLATELWDSIKPTNISIVGVP